MRTAQLLGVILVAGGCSGSTDETAHTTEEAPTDDAPLVEQPSTIAEALGPAVTLAADPQITSMVESITAARMSQDLSKLVGFGTRNSCSTTSSSTQGIGAARAWVRTQLTAVGHQADDIFTSSFCGTSRTHKNIFAWIPGTEPSRLIVVGGHMDSRSTNVLSATQAAPGANDSGSQTSVVLAAARAMTTMSFRATVVFIAFTGEEQGLVGSKNFAGKVAAYFPGATVEAALISDIVGGDVSANNATTLQQFRLFAPGTPRERSSTAPNGVTDDTSPARGLMRSIALATGTYVPAMTILPNLREDRPGRGSDHISFNDRGVPGVRFIETVENTAHQHSGLDTIANMTPAYMERVARVVTASAASLARAPAAPRSISVTGNASGNIQINWSPPLTGGVDHYVLAARPVTSSFYVSRVSIPSNAGAAVVSPAVLGISGGQAFFVSVAAVDAAGHESLFAYPEYRCGTVCEIQLGSLDVTSTL